MDKKGESKNRSEGKYADNDDNLSSDDKYCEGKYSETKGNRDDNEYLDDGKNNEIEFDIPHIDVTGLIIQPTGKSAIEDPLELNIIFSLDRDVVAGYWEFKFLVDSASSRIIKILGQSPVEDYPDGESEVSFKSDYIDISGIPPSTLTNSGLLMACFKVHGEEVATVNMVVNVTKESNGEIVREILNPLE